MNVPPWEPLFAFPTKEDNYTFADYTEDGVHFATLGRIGVELRKVANAYFSAHYPPEDRAQRCLNLFWMIEVFLSKNSGGQIPDKDGLILRWERGTKAAWDYYSKLKYGDTVTDDIAIVEITNILLRANSSGGGHGKDKGTLDYP